MLVHLDTNVLIRGLPATSPLSPNDTTQISSLVYAEFLEGLISDNPRVVVQTQRQLSEIDRLYDGGVPFDGETAKLYQVLAGIATRSGLSSRQRRIDLMIAAAAVRHGAAMATYNAADFAALGDAVQVIDLGGSPPR